MSLRIAKILPDRTTDGPGLRTTVWFQGCSIGRSDPCPGCFNHMLFPALGGEEMSALSIVSQLEETQQPVTLLGGEPTDQFSLEFSILLYLLSIRPWAHPIVLYSGYTLDELMDQTSKRSMDNADHADWIRGMSALCMYADVLVDGRFDPNHAGQGEMYRGSKNQRVIDLASMRKLADLGVSLNYHDPIRLDAEWDRPTIRFVGGKIQISLELARQLYPDRTTDVTTVYCGKFDPLDTPESNKAS